MFILLVAAAPCGAFTAAEGIRQIGFSLHKQECMIGKMTNNGEGKDLRYLGKPYYFWCLLLMLNGVKNNEVRAISVQDFQFFPLCLFESLEKKIWII